MTRLGRWAPLASGEGGRIPDRLLAAAWVVAVLGVSAQVAASGSGNFGIFRDSFTNLIAGADPYRLHREHQDFLLYPPPFALLFAPFAVLPEWLGLLAWNALNAGVLYWGLGRVLQGKALRVARVIVFLDMVGSMQSAQSNGLVAGLMLIGCGELDRRREWRAAVALGLGAAVKVFPLVTAWYAIFRPYRAPKFLVAGAVVLVTLLAAPLLAAPAAAVAEHYRSWLALQQAEALSRGHSIMFHIHGATGLGIPNFPIQLVGAAILLAPLARLQFWGIARFRLLFLASVLMFCVLFNHAAESPTFVVAVAGVAIWFTQAPRGRLTWVAMGLAVVGTILSTSDAIPPPIQEQLFDPYRFKTLPVLLVWALTQRELWRQSASAGSPASPAGRG